jgi:hypothetical protein
VLPFRHRLASRALSRISPWAHQYNYFFETWHPFVYSLCYLLPSTLGGECEIVPVMMHPFHSNRPRREWQSPSFLKPSLPGKRPSSLPRSSAFSASAPRKVTVCRHAARETDPAGQSTPNQYSTSLCKVQSRDARNPDGWLTGRWGSRESLALIDVYPRVCGLPLLHSAPSDLFADI